MAHDPIVLSRNQPLPNFQIIREHFDRAADRYDRHAAIEQEVCRRLLERCEYHRRSPEVTLDLGCGTGQGSEAIKGRFRRAQVIGVDASTAMLGKARRRSTLFRPLRMVCADMGRLPLAAYSADMIFSSLALHFCANPTALFDEFRRVLRPDGMLLFAALGPGSMTELCGACAEAGVAASLQPLPDLMEIGDALLAAGFTEPVMDMERITVSYRNLDALAEELAATGASLLMRGVAEWATEIRQLEKTLAVRQGDGRFPVSFEILYGTAFGPPEGQPRRTAEGDVATFSVDGLLKSRPMGYHDRGQE